MRRLVIAALLLVPFASQAQGIVARLKSQAEAGNTAAMVELHRYYVCGHTMPVDTAEAVRLLTQASSLGDKDAKALLSGYMLTYFHDTASAIRLADEAATAGAQYGIVRQAIHLQEGIGGSRNYRLAMQMLTQAADAGNPSACLALGRMYLYGADSCDRDPQRALRYLKRAPERVNARKYTYMADYYLGQSDYGKACKWIEKGVAQGEMYAQLDAVQARMLGTVYPKDERAAIEALMQMRAKYGDNASLLRAEVGIRLMATDPALRDDSLCRNLLLKIGDTPDMDNYNLLGQSYYYGQFTPTDTVAALRYWRKGAAKGDPLSMVHIGVWHIDQSHIDSACHYLDRACALACDEAFATYAKMYATGVFGSEDIPTALTYAREAARMGNTEARVYEGKLLLWQGDTAASLKAFDRAIADGYTDAYLNKAYVYLDHGDLRHGIPLLEKGSRQGSSACSNSLGGYYASEGKYAKAAHYFEQSGDAEARYGLAYLYLNGDLGNQTEADVAKGLGYLRSSAADGYRDAAHMLAKMYLGGVVVEQNYDSALSLLRPMADAADPYALYNMGTCCLQGMGMAIDSAEALRYYERAGQAGVSEGYAKAAQLCLAGFGNQAPDSARALDLYRRGTLCNDEEAANALYGLATCYLQGIATPKDTAHALHYLRQAAAAGSAPAASALGDMYNYGLGGLAANGDTALAYYLAASRGDDPKGDYMIGAYLYEEGAYDNAMGFITSAMGNGYGPAAVLYAQALLSGNGVEADPAQGIALLEQALPTDATGQAHFMYGIAHYNGIGVAPDHERGLELIEQAATMGNLRAMMSLGRLYASADSTLRNPEKAIGWFEQAASRGSSSAQIQLAELYAEGTLVPKDLKRAAALYQQAADAGNLDAKCRLGLCYENGDGVVLNSRRAYNLYMEAAEAGSAWGMRLVAYCYVEGVYAEPDMAEAAQWFLRSAEAGDVQSCYIVGQMYAQGEGLKKNKKEARRWLGMAAEAGHTGAVEALLQL